MAGSIFVLCLLLVVLVTAQGCSAQLDHKDDTLVSTLQEISNSTVESLRLHRQNTGALRDIHALLYPPAMVQLMKKEIAQENEKTIESMKKEFRELLKVEQLTQANAELKIKLTENEKRVQDLDKRLQESLQRAQEQDDTEHKLNQTVHDLKNRLQESERLVADLESTFQELNQTMECKKKEVDQDPECSQPQIQKIKDVVQRYNSSNDQHLLRADLESALDSSSEEYRQLQSLERDEYFTYRLGEKGGIQLASLLLCAGLHVDTIDSGGETMLHGAAYGGQVQMVKLLLEHGAQVDARGIQQYTPLIRAAYQGYLEMVKVLVEAGASTTAMDADGRTALEAATVNNRMDIVRYLLQRQR